MLGSAMVHAVRRCSLTSRIATLLLSGLSLGVAPHAGALAQAAPAERAAPADLVADHIAEASQRFGIPEHWIRAVLRAESAADVRAISSAGAMGLMQVMPATWDQLRARHSLGADPYDPRGNILAGTAYLREVYDRYGNVVAMLAAYNAGPGRYDEHLSASRPLPAETRAYVASLAPLLGAEPILPSVATERTGTADWRAAPLFVQRAELAAGAPQTTSAEHVDGGANVDRAQSDDVPAAANVTDLSAIAPPSHGLFVPRATAGGSQ
jgi:hypothetical protein